MRLALLFIASTLGLLNEPARQVNAATVQAIGGQHIDIKAVRKFCDVGFRYTAGSLQIDIEKIVKLGIHVDAKALVALQSQAALKAQAMQYDCQMFAAEKITAEQFRTDLRGILSYVTDVSDTAKKAEQNSGEQAPVKPREGDAQYWADQLGIKIETIFPSQESGNPVVILNDRVDKILKRYYCTCKPIQ